MNTYILNRKRVLFLAFSCLIIGVFAILTVPKVEAEPFSQLDNITIEEGPIMIQGNSLLSVAAPSAPDKPIRKINMLITAYSSTVWQTDDTPFITASGAYVEDGIVANNGLPFGTKIRIPELFGEKVFVVEDRMHQRKSSNHLDIWFPEYMQALSFGAQKAYIEVLEN